LSEQKERQLKLLQERLEQFLEALDAIDPERLDVENIDELIQYIEQLEEKCQQLKS